MIEEEDKRELIELKNIDAKVEIGPRFIASSIKSTVCVTI